MMKIGNTSPGLISLPAALLLAACGEAPRESDASFEETLVFSE